MQHNNKIDPAYPPPPNPAQPPPPSYNYMPPPPGYSAGPSNTTVVVTQPGLFGPQPGSTFYYREIPGLVVCQYCNATVTTTTTYSVGTFTWLACGIILFLGFWLLCCLIPFCMDGCKDVIHTCPNCRQVVGRYKRM